VTLGAGSLTGLPINQRDFDLPIDSVIHVGCPHFWRHAETGETEEQFASRLAAELDETITREGADTVAAFIGEPVMGAGGVIVPPATYWPKVQEVCRKHDVLAVVDEVITGFGRTGRLFACETYEIRPDILVLSKQLTSSYFPLAAVLFSDCVYQAIAENSARIGTLGHGFTTSGHPVATAVALENLSLIEGRGLVAHAAAMGTNLQQGLQQFVDHPLVGEVRGVALIAGVELVADKLGKTPFAPTGRVGGYVTQRCQAHGLLIRNIGDTIAFCPPLIIEQPEIEQMIARFSRALDETWAWLENQ
jgi:4-aminobutyrate--pyruvate transaminase